MNRLLGMCIMTSTLMLFFMPFIKQTHARNMRSPCILTALEKALVSELTRFHESSYLATQENIEKCIVLEGTVIIIYYENGHIGLFSSGDTIDLDSRQKQIESRSTKAPDELRDIINQSAGNDEVTNLFNEFVDIWYSARSPDELSQEKLMYADALAQKLLAAMPSSQFTFSAIGSRGNRYLALVEQLGSLPVEMLLAFYEGYIDSGYIDSDNRARTEDIPTDDDKRVVIRKVVNMFETKNSHEWSFHTSTLLKEIKRVDPISYVRFQELGIIRKND